MANYTRLNRKFCIIRPCYKTLDYGIIGVENFIRSGSAAERRENMVNLIIGDNIVSLDAFNVDTREDTTNELLETISNYAKIASVYYWCERPFNFESMKARDLCDDIDHYLKTKP